jgi:hypothetical protein
MITQPLAGKSAKPNGGIGQHSATTANNDQQPPTHADMEKWAPSAGRKAVRGPDRGGILSVVEQTAIVVRRPV